jgi:Holliday junction resolvase-like predicted endonuclease
MAASGPLFQGPKQALTAQRRLQIGLAADAALQRQHQQDARLGRFQVVGLTPNNAFFNCTVCLFYRRYGYL